MSELAIRRAQVRRAETGSNVWQRTDKILHFVDITKVETQCSVTSNGGHQSAYSWVAGLKEHWIMWEGHFDRADAFQKSVSGLPAHLIYSYRKFDAMRQILIATGLAIIIVSNHQVLASDQAQKAESAENKAKVLERDAASGGNEAMPSQSETITKPETRAVDPSGTEPLDEAIICLSRTIYWETKGENAASMEAVANVVMNRLEKPGFPKTICDVVREGREQGACQFSWWCDGRADDAEDEESYGIAKEVARKALNMQLTDRTGGALYFHHGEAKTNWAAEYSKTAEVGKFIFYKPHAGAAK